MHPIYFAERDGNTFIEGVFTFDHVVRVNRPQVLRRSRMFCVGMNLELILYGESDSGGVLSNGPTCPPPPGIH